MQPRSQPLPVKWYLLSALGALLLALILLAMFSTRPADIPTISGNPVGQDADVQAVSAPNQAVPPNLAPVKPQPQSNNPFPKPNPRRPGSRTLWSMVATPLVIYSSAAVTAAGFLTGVAFLWVMRRRFSR